MTQEFDDLFETLSSSCKNNSGVKYGIWTATKHLDEIRVKFEDKENKFKIQKCEFKLTPLVNPITNTFEGVNLYYFDETCYAVYFSRGNFEPLKLMINICHHSEDPIQHHKEYALQFSLNRNSFNAV